MTMLSWSKVGERLFEAGLDRGVLYPPAGTPVAWSGLTSIEESVDDDAVAFYIDGIKYLDHEVLGDFSAKLKAFTYPDEFEEFDGVKPIATGLLAHDQPAKSFGLSYRTQIGNDVDGSDHGYKIHILYNVLAVAESTTFASIAAETNPLEFAWTLLTTPDTATGYRPTAHLVIDSTEVNEYVLANLESMLYGTPTADPYLPTLQQMVQFAIDNGLITITDHGDGTWSATGPDQLVELLTSTSFQIDEIDVVWVDANTYTITTTTLS
jgi:hypothetical protein